MFEITCGCGWAVTSAVELQLVLTHSQHGRNCDKAGTFTITCVGCGAEHKSGPEVFGFDFEACLRADLAFMDQHRESCREAASGRIVRN